WECRRNVLPPSPEVRLPFPRIFAAALAAVVVPTGAWTRPGAPSPPCWPPSPPTAI
ncbi:MAG: hypothetical protein AVDCRST_MAG68-3442, partial [uncultured Gemmatimonadetes bacterium]